MPRIGFVGVGTIANAVARGLLARYGDDISVALSPRNAEKAAALAAQFPNVEVKASNQEVLDSSDWVVLAVIPRVAKDVLTALSFRADHQVVDLVANFSLEQVREWVGSTASLTRMVPLPFIAQRVGPLALYPDSAQVAEFFEGLGDLVPARNERELDVLQVVTALMSPYYATLGAVVSWGAANGLPAELSARYTISFFEALLQQAKTLSPGQLGEIWKEMTPGGLNELAVTHIQEAGSLAAWEAALDKVLARVLSMK
ncbi:MAG: NAD(P)-binding domain-containing protein [Propionibacteriaceae bacterium]|jgi:pyrroline-5-carboxylate reductase|nr:NAD(P)-binding domain-containing protein [Propionibacteriaceae bacterium]